MSIKEVRIRLGEAIEEEVPAFYTVLYYNSHGYLVFADEVETTIEALETLLMQDLTSNKALYGVAVPAIE